nr:Tn7-like element transposition protein TnsE [Psychrobacter sp. JCM 18901]
MPAIGRSRLHRTIDGNKRSLLEVRIETDISQFVVLEVDTTDNSKPISTLIVKINNIDYWNDHIDELLSIVVKSSLRWPKASYLKKIWRCPYHESSSRYA